MPPAILSAKPLVMAQSALFTAARPAPRILASPLLKQHTAGLTRRSATTISAAAASGASSSAGKDDVQGEMLPAGVTPNNPVVRLAALAATVAAAAYSSSVLPTAAVGFVHMLAFSSWFGTLMWTSTVFGIVAFRNLPRQTFGKLQSKLFPKYFAVSTAAPALLLATLHFGCGGAPPSREVTLLGIAAGASLLNLVFLEPAATNVMFQRYALENAEGGRDEAAIKALYKQFGKWHGISSLLNLAVLVCAVGHAYYLGGHLMLV